MNLEFHLAPQSKLLTTPLHHHHPRRLQLKPQSPLILPCLSSGNLFTHYTHRGPGSKNSLTCSPRLSPPRLSHGHCSGQPLYYLPPRSPHFQSVLQMVRQIMILKQSSVCSCRTESLFYLSLHPPHLAQGPTQSHVLKKQLLNHTEACSTLKIGNELNVQS